MLPERTRLWLLPDWRRTVLALVFAGSGLALTGVAVWLVRAVIGGDWPLALAAARLTIVGRALYAVLALLGLVLTGLAMTVALRQVSARFMGADFSASGGHGDDAPDEGSGR